VDVVSEVIERAKKRMKECTDAESNNRDRAIEAINFKEGNNQWPEKVKKDRERDDRPCLTLNRIPAYVRQVVNDMRQTRPAIKVRGVDSEADPETADILNGMIKAIEQSCNAEGAYDWAAEGAVTSGWGYFRIDTDYADPLSFEQDISVKRVLNPFTIYLDADAVESDRSDCKYAFVDSWMDRETFDEKYPKAEGGWDTIGKGTSRELWYKEDSLRVPEYWEIEEEEHEISLMPDGTAYMGNKEGAIRTRKTKIPKVTQYIINGVEVLETKPWAGKYIPIIPVLGEEMNIEGEIILKGLVNDTMDSQRQYNYWRTAATERVALYAKAPYIGYKGQFKDNKWRNANSKNYPYLEASQPKDQGTLPLPRREPPPDISPGMANEIATSANEIKEITGILDPALGAQSTEVSERALLSKQQRSDKSNFHFTDNLARAMTHAGRIMVDLIPKIYDTPRMVNIIHPGGDEEMVQINQEYIDQKTQKPKNFNLKAGKYDVAVTVGPSYATQRQESAEAMLEMAGMDQRVLPLIGDLLAKNFDWTESDEVAKRLKTLLPAEIIGQENPQVAAIIQQSQQQVQQAQQYIGQLEQALKEMNVQLQNKQGEIQVKQTDNDRKLMETVENLQLKWATLELEDRNKLLDIIGKGIEANQASRINA